MIEDETLEKLKDQAIQVQMGIFYLCLEELCLQDKDAVGKLIFNLVLDKVLLESKHPDVITKESLLQAIELGIALLDDPGDANKH